MWLRDLEAPSGAVQPCFQFYRRTSEEKQVIESENWEMEPESGCDNQFENQHDLTSNCDTEFGMLGSEDIN